MTAKRWRAHRRRRRVGPPCVILDESVIGESSAVDGEGGLVEAHRLSSDGQLSAYTVDWDGTDEPTGFLDWLGADGQGPPERIGSLGSTRNIVFVGYPRPSGVLVVEPDETLRCRTVKWFPLERNHPRARPSVGPPQVLFDEPAEDLFVDVTVSKDGKMGAVNLNDRGRSEVWVFGSPSNAAGGPPKLRRFVHRDARVMAFVEHAGNVTLMLTSADNAPTFRVRAISDDAWNDGSPRDPICPVAGPLPGYDLVPPDPDWVIEDMDVFGDATVARPRTMVLYERSTADGSCRVRLGRIPADGPDATPAELQPVRLLPGVCEVEPGVSLDPQARYLRVSLAMPTQPPVLCEVDLVDTSLHPLQPRRGPPEFPPPFSVAASDDRGKWWNPAVWVSRTPPSPNALHATRVIVPSTDDAQVPVTVVAPRRRWDHKLEALQDGPLLLHGYGCYGHVLDPRFSLSWGPLWANGWAVAFSHGRGGGEKGPQWYADGCGEKKWNAVVDFLRVGQWLQASRWTRPATMAAMGESAGGWLLARSVMERPSQFAGAVLQSPFTHLSASMRDPTLPLTAPEYREWGHAEEQDGASSQWDRLCPMANLPDAAALPPLFVWWSLRDGRVRPADTADFVSAVDHAFAKTKGSGGMLPVYAEIDAEGTHGGPTDGGQLLELHARQAAWLLHLCGTFDN